MDEHYPSLTDLEAAIFRYLDTPHTDYAVMIDGEWGSGKTHFWRNTIERRLVTQKKKVLYVSLYGVTGGPEIDWRIAEELSPVLANTGWFGSTLARLGMGRFGITPEMLFYRSALSDYILCFDDLE